MEQPGRRGEDCLDQYLNAFSSTILSPLANFFTKTVPGWFSALVSTAKSAWQSVWNAFSSTVLSSLTAFFTKTIPGWFGGFVAGRSRLEQYLECFQQLCRRSLHHLLHQDHPRLVR